MKFKSGLIIHQNQQMHLKTLNLVFTIETHRLNIMWKEFSSIWESNEGKNFF
jgi:hypothetical protein